MEESKYIKLCSREPNERDLQDGEMSRYGVSKLKEDNVVPKEITSRLILIFLLQKKNLL